MLNAYLPPFREGVKAGSGSVMSAFNAIENIPASGNKKYLRDILRGKFGFDGVVISDACSVTEMLKFGYCETKKDCAYRALKAGLDIELGTDCYRGNAEALLGEGRITMAEIDEAVLRVLTKKFELGLFDAPFAPFARDKSVVYSQKHLELSEKSALESAVLLVSVTLANERNVAGCEIVQLYIRDEVAEVVRPQRELKDFRRVELQAGEEKTVNFVITEDMLAYYHTDGELYADEGAFTVYVGENSDTENQAKFTLEDRLQ